MRVHVPFTLLCLSGCLQVVRYQLPPLREDFTDSQYGATLFRFSNESQAGDFGTHIYSQLQAFSTDDELVLLIENNRFVIRSVADGSLVLNDPGTWNSPRWHPFHAHKIVHFDSNGVTTVRLQFTNVDSGTTRTGYTFPDIYVSLSPD
jgi:hypothetical protein